MGFFKKKKVGSEDSPSAVRVSNFLNDKTVVFFPTGPSKRQAFGQLLGLLDLPDPSGALKAILAREEAGSTVIAPGLALPHARIPGITKLQAAIGICPSGIHYSSAAEDPVQIILLFLGPSENMREHLAFLASVSALLQNKALVKSLLQQTAPAQILGKIKDAEKAL